MINHFIRTFTFVFILFKFFFVLFIVPIISYIFSFFIYIYLYIYLKFSYDLFFSFISQLLFGCVLKVQMKVWIKYNCCSYQEIYGHPDVDFDLLLVLVSVLEMNEHSSFKQENKIDSITIINLISQINLQLSNSLCNIRLIFFFKGLYSI